MIAPTSRMARSGGLSLPGVEQDGREQTLTAVSFRSAGTTERETR